MVAVVPPLQQQFVIFDSGLSDFSDSRCSAGNSRSLLANQVLGEKRAGETQ